MNIAPELLLVAAVGGVGVLHTLVPDHWVPIALLARQRGWSKRETARAAAGAGLGHTLSTLLIGLLVWAAGAAVAARFGNLVSLVSSIALIAFGVWIAVASLRELREDAHEEHGHAHAQRTALLLILGSSPMVEGIPAFFAAARYGIGLLAVMSVVFGVATIATYVALCVSSTAGLQRVRFGPIERYGEVISGAFIALIGLVFLVYDSRAGAIV